jgi:hypothetical protein
MRRCVPQQPHMLGHKGILVTFGIYRYRGLTTGTPRHSGNDKNNAL